MTSQKFAFTSINLDLLKHRYAMIPMDISATRSMAETMPRMEMASRQGSPFSNGIEPHTVLLLCHIILHKSL